MPRRNDRARPRPEPRDLGGGRCTEPSCPVRYPSPPDRPCSDLHDRYDPETGPPLRGGPLSRPGRAVQDHTLPPTEDELLALTHSRFALRKERRP